MSRYALKGLGSADFSATYTSVPARSDRQAGGGEYRPVLAAQQMLLRSTPIAQPQPGPAAYPGTLTVDEQRAMPTGAMRLGPIPRATSPFTIANASAGMSPGSRSIADASGIRTAGHAVDQAHDASLVPTVDGSLTHREDQVTSGSSSSTGSSASASYGAWAVAITASVLVIGGLAWWVWRR